MRRKLVLLAVLCLSISAVGCSNQSSRGTTDTETVEDRENESEDTKDEKKEDSTEEALAGVYLNGGSIEEIEMGTFYEGEQKNFCSVKMPTKYIWGPLYTNEEGESVSFSDLTVESLQESIDNGSIEKLSGEGAISSAYLYSLEKDGSDLRMYVDTSDSWTMDEVKEDTPDGVEFGTEEHPAYYYVNPDVFDDADLCIGYQINDDILLSIIYSGPLAKEIGLEQLAQNLYDLVEVID